MTRCWTRPDAASPRDWPWWPTCRRRGAGGAAVGKPSRAATAVVKGVEVYVPREGVIDFREEHARLSRELAKVEQGLDRVTKKLANEDFLRKAPEAVVEQQRAAQRELLDTQTKLRESLGRMAPFLTHPSPSPPNPSPLEGEG